MKHHLIVSSLFTGGKNAGHGKEIVQAINLGLNNVTVSESNRPGHAEELTRQALRSGAESILVAAGDSMINEVVNGFFENDRPVAERPRLGVIPTKAGGDFRRTAGMSSHLMEAVQRIGDNEPKTIDLGRVVAADGKSRYFANVASTGVTASIGKSNRRTQWLNAIDEDLSFNWAVIKGSLLHRRFPLNISMPKNGGAGAMKWDANCVAICNGNVFGGGINVSDDADITDGFLDVVVVHDFTNVEFLKGVKQIREGKREELEKGISTIRATSILLTCDDPEVKVPFDIDGQFAGHLPARFDVVPGAAQLY